jgi:uncharacterized protein (TIGR02118 family)
MVRLSILYNTPADPASFLEHYEKVHAPLCQALPKARFAWGRGLPGLGGEDPPYFLNAEFWFEEGDDASAIGAAFGGPEGAAIFEDVVNLQGTEMTMLVSESR